MIYRVILAVGYYERWFDFDTIEEAGEFAKVVLWHQIPGGNSKDLELSITIKVVINKEQEEE